MNASGATGMKTKKAMLVNTEVGADASQVKRARSSVKARDAEAVTRVSRFRILATSEITTF